MQIFLRFRIYLETKSLNMKQYEKYLEQEVQTVNITRILF